MNDLTYTAHNVRFPDGTYTMAKDLPLLSDRPQIKSILNILKDVAHLIPEQSTLVDLGCLEGGYAVEFARAGYRTTGIEVRANNFACCEQVRAKAGLNHLKFVMDDVRNTPKYGPFDVTFCAGLLYHLDQPIEFIKMLAKQTNKVLVLHTHFSNFYEPMYDGFQSKTLEKLKRRLKLKSQKRNFHLSKIETHEGVQGRWYGEFAPEASENQQEGLRWASWKNHRSFWVTKEDLMVSLKSAGFDYVFESFDHLNLAEHSLEANSWGQFIAIKKLT
jgi:hypothetical protein